MGILNPFLPILPDAVPQQPISIGPKRSVSFSSTAPRG